MRWPWGSRTWRAQPSESAFSTLLGDSLVACVRRPGLHTLVVAVPREVNTDLVHQKLAKAIALYERRIGVAEPSGGNGSSGAPAEVAVARVRAS